MQRNLKPLEKSPSNISESHPPESSHHLQLNDNMVSNTEITLFESFNQTNLELPAIHSTIEIESPPSIPNDQLLSNINEQERKVKEEAVQADEDECEGDFEVGDLELLEEETGDGDDFFVIHSPSKQ